MNTLAHGAGRGFAGVMEIFHLLLALVIVAAAWVLVAQLLGIGARHGVSNDHVTHGD